MVSNKSSRSLSKIFFAAALVVASSLCVLPAHVAANGQGAYGANAYGSNAYGSSAYGAPNPTSSVKPIVSAPTSTVSMTVTVTNSYPVTQTETVTQTATVTSSYPVTHTVTQTSYSVTTSVSTQLCSSSSSTRLPIVETPTPSPPPYDTGAPVSVPTTQTLPTFTPTTTSCTNSSAPTSTNLPIVTSTTTSCTLSKNAALPTGYQPSTDTQMMPSGSSASTGSDTNSFLGGLLGSASQDPAAMAAVDPTAAGASSATSASAESTPASSPPSSDPLSGLANSLSGNGSLLNLGLPDSGSASVAPNSNSGSSSSNPSNLDAASTNSAFRSSNGNGLFNVAGFALAVMVAMQVL